MRKVKIKIPIYKIGIFLCFYLFLILGCDPQCGFEISVDEDNYPTDKSLVIEAINDLDGKVFHFISENGVLWKYAVKGDVLYYEISDGADEQLLGKVYKAYPRFYKAGSSIYFLTYNTRGGFDSMVINLQDSTFFVHQKLLSVIIPWHGRISCVGDSIACAQPNLFLAKEIHENY